MKPTRLTKEYGWGWGAALCTFALLFAVADTNAAPRPVENWKLANIAVVKAEGAREGSALACVRDLVAQGMTVKEALDRCFVRSELVPQRTGIDSFLSLGGSITSSTTVGTAACNAGSKVRPELSADYDWANHDSRIAPPNPNEAGLGNFANDLAYQQLKDEAQRQWEQYYDLLTQYAEEDRSKWTSEQWEQNLEKLNKENREANEAIDNRDSWKPSTVLTDPNAVSFCVDIAAFVGECNSAGWKTSPCSIFLSRLEGCSDPTVTDPHPDGDGRVGCEQPPPDTETVERLAALVCNMRIYPLPDEDPCTPVESGGIVIDGWVRLAPCREAGDKPLGADGPTIPCDSSGDATPCGNPAALTTEDQCVVSVEIAQFGEKNIEEILAIAGDRLGGPSFVVPLPKGPDIPGGGGPDPEGP